MVYISADGTIHRQPPRRNRMDNGGDCSNGTTSAVTNDDIPGEDSQRDVGRRFFTPRRIAIAIAEIAILMVAFFFLRASFFDTPSPFGEDGTKIPSSNVLARQTLTPSISVPAAHFGPRDRVGL